MTPRAAWRHLGIAPTGDARAVRRAYADKLRNDSIANDPDAFARLRAARDTALANLLTAADAEPEDFGLGELADAPHAAAATPPAGFAPRIERTPETLVGVVDLQGNPAFDPAAPYSEAAHPAAPTNAARQDVPVPAVAFGPPVLDLAPRDDAVRLDTTHPSQALHDLLLEHDVETPLNAHEVWQAETYIEAIAREANDADIEAHARIDAWIAEVLARAVPRSDPLIRFAARQFGWEARVNDIDLPPSLHYLIERQKTLNFITEISDPGHRLHRAWTELARPAREGSRRGFFVKKRDVAELLNTVRQQYPDVESWYFDGWRVGLWEKVTGGGGVSGLGPIWWGIIIFIAFIRIAVAISDDKPTPGNSLSPPPVVLVQKLSTPADDIDQVMTDVTKGSVSGATLEEKNPALFAILQRRWQSARGDGLNLADYRFAETTYLRSVVQNAVPLLPYDVVAERRRLEADLLTAARGNPDYPGGCEALLRKQYGGGLGDALDKRANEAIGATLLAIDKTPKIRPSEWTYTIPGSVVTATTTRLHVARDDFNAALNGKIKGIDRCTARIALLRAALAAPPNEGLKLLREM